MKENIKVDYEDLVEEEEDGFVVYEFRKNSKKIKLKANKKQPKTSIMINKKYERNNSNDKIDRNSFTRIITKKQNEYFNEFNTINTINENNIDIDNIEHIKDFRADCILYDKNNIAYTGKLFVVRDYIMCFAPELNDKAKLFFNDDYYIIPLLSISQCITNTNYFGQSKYCKEITLKDGRNFIFKFSPEAFEAFGELIEKFSFPKISKNYFNFTISNKQNSLINKKNIKIYNFFDEFKRQGIILNPNNTNNTNKEYRLIKNENFTLCESYPKKLIIPYNISDEQIRHSAEFRTKNRIPTLTYRYSKNNSCIWRSSQTKGGILYNSNEDDVELLTQIANHKKLYIYDARPYLNAVINKVKGAGYEHINNYQNIDMEIIFCGIPNIHQVRKSYFALLNTVSYETKIDKTLYSNITSSSWHEYIITLIKSSFQICERIKQNANANVLIHCSDGWDRTSQLCSLSQILLDKYYRTLNGFICLIEKDWLSFGHQFRYRNGFYSKFDSPHHIISDNQFSPIFLQWLDAVFQLMIQNYESFEFNFELILLLAEELYSGKYGTFMFNNDKERELFEEDKTYSIWNYIKENEKNYINKIYNKDNNQSLTFNYKKIKLWEDYFYRFEKGYKVEQYFSLHDEKIFGLESEINKDKNIIEKMAKFIKKHCQNEEIEKLDEESKKIISKLNK